MKKGSLLVGIICSAALMAPLVNAEVYSRNVVGYHNITIEPGLNLAAFPFQKIPADTGVVDANTATTITVNDAGWGADFGYVEEGDSTFYIEITTAAFEGRHFYIESHTADTLTIAGGLPEDVNPSDLVGAGYKIVAANRIRDLFGEPGSPVLTGGSSSVVADTILPWVGSSWGTAIFYQTEDAFGFPVDEWKQGGVTVSDMVVDRDEALFVRRREATDAVLTVVGEVSPNAQQIVLSTGLNLIGGLAVADEIVGDSTLTDTLAGSSSSAFADTILPWGGSSWETAVFYQTEDAFGFPVNEWKQGGATVTETFAFTPIRGYFVRVRQDPIENPFWLRPSVLAAQ